MRESRRVTFRPTVLKPQREGRETLSTDYGRTEQRAGSTVDALTRVDALVVMFMRRLDKRIAGGARAVLERANTFADRGHRVLLVVTEPSPVSEVGLSHFRKKGTVHPRVQVKNVWNEAPTSEHRRLALQTTRVALPQPGASWDHEVHLDDKDTVSQIDYTLNDELMRRDRYVGGQLLHVTLYDSEVVSERWFVDHLGRVATHVTYVDALPSRRWHYVGGTFCWLEADVSVGEGLGEVFSWGGAVKSGVTVADVVADWLDRYLETEERVVLFADGENVAQHALRSMQHPGVRGVSILHNCHTEYPHGSDDPTKAHWVRYFDDQNNVNEIVCLTQKQRKDIIDRYPKLDPIVVHHAVPPTPKPQVERDFSKVVFVGRLQEQKRLHDAIRAFDQVRAAIPAATFDIYGTGNHLESLEQLVVDLGLERAVTFQGFTNNSAAAFASAGVAVMSSLHEGLPLTLTEAMAVGTPFVAYDINYGPAEVIESGVNGLLITPGDVDALAEGLISVLDNPRRSRQMGAEARKVEANFSRERYEEAWLSLANQVLADDAHVSSKGLS